MAQYTPWSASPSHSLISTVDYNYQYYGGPMSSEQTWDPSVTTHPVRETVANTYKATPIVHFTEFVSEDPGV